MSKEYESMHREFLKFSPKEKINYVEKMATEIVLLLNQKNIEVKGYIAKIGFFKAFVSLLYRLSGVYKKEFFDFLVNTIRNFWESLERCSSQKLLYPALSAFMDLFSQLKGLSPFYTLHGVLSSTITYGAIPSKDEVKELLAQEMQQLSFLLDYMQLGSVLRFIDSEEDKVNIIKSATNFSQILVLTLYNFLVNIPVLSIEQFTVWCKLFEESLEKAFVMHGHLKEIKETGIGLLRVKISESSMIALKTQFYLLRARYINENVDELLNYAYIEASKALQELEPYHNHMQFSEISNRYYYQQKSLLLETRFYQILQGVVSTQYKNSKYIGDIKDDKSEITKQAVRLQVQEILREIHNYITLLLAEKEMSDIGISTHLISVYSKIVYGSYIYDLANEIEMMENLSKTRHIDISDADQSLLLAHYWLYRWAETEEYEMLKTSCNYFERATEIFSVIYNNSYVPIYGYSMLTVIHLILDNIPRAEMFIMKADDEFNSAKNLMIVNESERHFYEQFRYQIDTIISGETVEKPLRFEKKFNPLDINTWNTEKKDWRKKIPDLPEPFPFHLEQLKILEFEFQ